MRIHGVSPKLIAEFRSLGYERLSPDDLVAMRIHGVTVEFAKRMKDRDPGITVDELVTRRIHGE